MSEFDIGLVGYWYATNYGSVMTYYALSLALNRIGYTTILIDRPEKERDPEGEDVISRNFLRTRCNISKSVKWNEIDSLSDLCDTFVVGSDQVWTTSAIRYFKYMFFLSFVSDEKKKIAYAPSFGSLNFLKLDSEQELRVKNYLERFDKISIREDSGAKMVKERFGINADRVLDPVFLITAEDYDDIAKDSSVNTDEKYILAYILDPTPDKEKFIKRVSEKLGINVRIVLDGRKGTFPKNKEKLTIYGDESVIPNVNVEDWIKLFKNSEYVLTDSHHGLAMAIIYNKNFICYANRSRGYERFTSLLGLLGLMNRMVDNSEQVTTDMIDISVDYSHANGILENEKEKSFAWLKKALVHKVTVNSVLDKTLCVGCGSCVSSCPVGAVSLRPDDLGYYRASVDFEMCLNCGKCVNNCPAIELPKKLNTDQPKLYALAAADKNLLFNSSSGGAFSLLAAEAFKRNGVVIGAAWRDDFTVEHIMIDTPDDLKKLQKSKYLQSYVGDILKKVKEKLEQNIFVLFTGCPCQVAGLRNYLGKEYDNLIAVDLLCGSAPSTLFFEKYLAEEFPNGLEKYEFRHKAEGWNCDCCAVTVNGVTTVIRGSKHDNYQRAYHPHIMCAPHCENCKYQSLPRYGDITIGDFWGIGSKDLSLDTSKGISAVLCNNEKGKHFFDSIPVGSCAVKKEEPLERLGGNGFAFENGHNWASPYRNDFYTAIKDKPFKDALLYAVKPDHNMKKIPALLDMRANEVFFLYDPAVWSIQRISGAILLCTKPARPKTKCYATLPLHEKIYKSKKYVFKARFKINTNESVYNFHLKSAGEDIYQVIYSHKVTGDDRYNWVEINREFTADSDIYDEFMIGAAQLNGENRWIAFDYIEIAGK